MNEEILIKDTKDRISNINKIAFSCRYTYMQSYVNHLFAEDKQKIDSIIDLTKDKNDFLKGIRETSRILLEDTRRVISNLRQMHINDEQWKVLFGFSIEEIKKTIYETIDSMIDKRESCSVINNSKFYKLINDTVSNYTEAANMINNYQYFCKQKSILVNSIHLKDKDKDKTITIEVSITENNGKIFINGEEVDCSKYL